MFEIRKNRKKEFYAVAVAHNGNTLFETSESYTRKHNVKKAIIALLKLFSLHATAVVVDTTKGARVKKYTIKF